MSGFLTRIDRTLVRLFDEGATAGERQRSAAARLIASTLVSLTGVVLLGPNLRPLLSGPLPAFGVVLSVLGSVVCVGLALSGYLLYRSDFSTANTVRIAVWNLLGVVVLGAVLWMHAAYQGVFGTTGVGSTLTAGNVLAISAAAHVIIGVHDARRVRAEQLARERQKLAVLNRVLRHNLRNEATVLMGHADRLERGVDDPDLAQSAEIVHDKAQTVGGLADKTKEIVNTLERSRRAVSPVQVSAVVDDVLDAPNPTESSVGIEVEVDESVHVWADSGFATALSEVVDNAVEHAETTVRVGLDVGDDGWVAVRVADDGPGIPEEERAVVTGETEITPLTHGSGLGLWVAQSAVEAGGGRLGIDTTESGGSVVSLSYKQSSAPEPNRPDEGGRVRAVASD